MDQPACAIQLIAHAGFDNEFAGHAVLFIGVFGL
jgi:hypothetical protein